MVKGYISLLCSIADKPLEYWSKQQTRLGQIRKVLDPDLLENVIEIQDTEQRGPSASLLCPADSYRSLNIELSLLVIVIKNISDQCQFQVQIIDEQNCTRYFQFCNADLQKRQKTRGSVIRLVKIELEPGWNKVELDLRVLTDAAFKAVYKATQRVEICGTCRLRRVYFIDEHYDNEQICSRLLQGFFDLYMLKWGIYLVDGATQTVNTRNRLKRGQDRGKLCHEDQTFNGHDKDEEANLAAGCSNFLRNVQKKINGTIDGFCTAQSTKASCILGLQDDARLKRYVVKSIRCDKIEPEHVPLPSLVNSKDSLRNVDVSSLSCAKNSTLSESIVDKEQNKEQMEEISKGRHFPRDSLIHRSGSLQTNTFSDASKKNFKGKSKSAYLRLEKKFAAGISGDKKNIHASSNCKSLAFKGNEDKCLPSKH